MREMWGYGRGRSGRGQRKMHWQHHGADNWPKSLGVRFEARQAGGMLIRESALDGRPFLLNAALALSAILRLKPRPICGRRPA